MATLVRTAKPVAPQVNLGQGNGSRVRTITLKGAPRLEGLLSFLREIGWRPSRGADDDISPPFNSNCHSSTTNTDPNQAGQIGNRASGTSPDTAANCGNGAARYPAPAAPVPQVTQPTQASTSLSVEATRITSHEEVDDLPVGQVQSGRLTITSADIRTSQNNNPELLDVQIRYTIKERLEKLEFASKVGLKADMTAHFTPEEVQKLRDFSTEYGMRRRDWFRGRRSPTVTFRLVALRKMSREENANGTKSEILEERTGITIIGLPSENHIREFHKIMSRKAIRDLYSPLRLCYDTALFRTISRRVEENYVSDDLGMGLTLCGAQIATVRSLENTRWISTIGGVVEVDDKLFAITSSHRPSGNKGSSISDQSTHWNVSNPSTIAEQDYDDDVKSALVLDYPSRGPSVAGRRDSIHQSVNYDSPMFTQLSTRSSTAEEGTGSQDWRLIPISSQHCLPNSFQNLGPDSRDFASQSQAVPREDGSGLDTNTVYVKGHLDVLSPRNVTVLTRRGSPPVRGTLLPTPGFFSVECGAATSEVWVVTLRGAQLQYGDSGAWAVDEQGKLVGMAIAASANDAYLAPFHIQMQQIEEAQPSMPRTVRLPSPLRCFLELSTAYRDGSAVRDEYVSAAISHIVLEASAPTDILALALLRARELNITTQPSSLHSLIRLLGVYGNEIRRLLSPGMTIPSPPLHEPGDDEIIAALKSIYLWAEGAILLRKTPSTETRLGSYFGSMGSTTLPPPVLSSGNIQIADQPNLGASANTNTVEKRANPDVELQDSDNTPSITLDLPWRYRFLIFFLAVVSMSMVGGALSAIAVAGLGDFVSSPAPEKGVAIGASLAAPIVFWSFWSGMAPRNIVPKPSTWYYARRGIDGLIRAALIIMRPPAATLVGCYVMDANSTDRSSLVTASLIVAVLYLPDPSLYHYLRLGRHGILQPYLLKQTITRRMAVMSILNVLYCTGRDSFAAYSFVKLSKNNGIYVVSDGTAALAGVVFSITYMFSRPVGVLSQWYLVRMCPRLLEKVEVEKSEKEKAQGTSNMRISFWDVPVWESKKTRKDNNRQTYHTTGAAERPIEEQLMSGAYTFA